MERAIKFLAAGFLTIILTVCLAPTSAISDTNLDVPLTIQEHSNWCWAASCGAVLSYYNKSVSQCDVASYAFNSQCCGNSTFNWNSSCNLPNTLSGMEMVLNHWGVFNQSYGPYTDPYTTQYEINKHQPFIMAWAWSGGGGHALVTYGYDDQGYNNQGQRLFYINYLDPWPGHGFTKSLYTWVINSSDHNWVETLQTTLVEAPTSVSAVAGNCQATISFTSPNSSMPITSYTVTSIPDYKHASGTSSPILLTGLSGGTLYSFTVRAYVGTYSGPESSESYKVMVYSIPDAPTNVTATADAAGGANVSFVTPNNNGSPITSYIVTSSPGNITATGSSKPIAVRGLAIKTTYTFTVKALNSAGYGPSSPPSNSVTTFGLAGPPTGVTANSSNGVVVVSFIAPIDNGGSPITLYSITANPPGNGIITNTGVTSPITAIGLNCNSQYTFTVKATNSAGYGLSSSPSNSVTPMCSAPNAPTNVYANGIGGGKVTVDFTIPNNNGSPITRYTVTSNPGNITGTGLGRPITVSGLSNGISYRFTVVATNIIGNSQASNPSNSVTLSNNMMPALGTWGLMIVVGTLVLFMSWNKRRTFI